MTVDHSADDRAANDPAADLQETLRARFGADITVDPTVPGLSELAAIAGHRTHRRYLDKPVAPELLRLVCACALSAPSKSDLQQCDIVAVRDAATRRRIAELIPDQPHVAKAPEFLVILADGHRLRHVARMRDKPFVNDHLDQFFNAAVDAGIVLATFLRAASAVGLGCCPISVIRDHAAEVGVLLDLPERVIPVCGLCVGWPSERGHVSPRLGLDSTLHVDRYDDRDLTARIDAYDRRRAAVHGYRPRDPERWGEAPFYGWSEDKARQYGVPQRADFGAFVRRKGFCLD